MNIEELDLEVKTYNRLKKAGINDTDELLDKMYQPDSVKLISQPDMKRVEAALKTVGLIKFMRGDYVAECDIEHEPLTWDELHSCIGKLVVHDCSTESHRWLQVCWIYDIQDDGEGNLIYNDGSSSYGYARRSSTNGERTRHPSPFLKYEGRLFRLKQEVTPMPETQILSAEYTKAVALTKRIKANAASAQESLWEVCKGLKEMHDGKLYKELGYQNFEDYSENEIGIRKVQAYKYITIGGMENVQSTEQIGAEKLFLLAKLDEPQREEIQQNVDLENTSVKELKAKIDDLKKANERLMGKVDEAEKKAAASRKSEESACGKLSILRTDSEMKEQKIIQLEQQIEELENRPIDVAVVSDSHEIANLKEAMKRVDMEWAQKYTELEEQGIKIQREEYRRHQAELEALKRSCVGKPDVAEVFNAYLSNAADSAKRLIGFINEHPDEQFRAKTNELFKSIITKTEE